MEILDKEKKLQCQESSTHPFQITKHGDVILWKYNMLPAAGVSKVQSHSCQPQWAQGVQFRNPWASTSAWHCLTDTWDPGAKFNLPEAKPCSWARPAEQD